MKTKTRKRKLTKIQMRVAIARDVIMQMNAQLLIAEHMTYIGGLYGQARAAGVDEGKSLQPYLLKKRRKPCTVCALGAGLIAVVRLENKLALGENYSIHDRLSKYFTPKQVEMLEILFEGFNYDPSMEYVGADKRLRFIWGYVAKQKGRFTPQQIKAAALVFGKKERARLAKIES